MKNHLRRIAKSLPFAIYDAEGATSANCVIRNRHEQCRGLCGCYCHDRSESYIRAAHHRRQAERHAAQVSAREAAASGPGVHDQDKVFFGIDLGHLYGD